MNDQQLQQLVEKVSLESFGKPFVHVATFNNRLRTTGGRYLLQSHNIELNRKHYEEFGKKELLAIIKHELCHYHLHLAGKGYKHRDEDFRKLLKEIDGSRFCRPLSTIKKKQLVTQHIYVCCKCAKKYNRKKRVNTNRYVCGSCGGKLKKLK